jgi:hypothetical protein
MERYIPTPVRFENFHAARGKFLRGRSYIRSFGIASKGDYGRMLEQQQYIANAIFLTEVNQFLLYSQSSWIIERAELKNRDHIKT